MDAGERAATEEIEEADHNEIPLDTAIERVRQLVSESDIEGARSLAAELHRCWPEDERVCYWARVLAPPEVRVLRGQRDRPLDQEREWLRQHAGEYPGCWLAVFQDRLIAADPDLGAVLKIVRQTPGAETAALYFSPPRAK
jgi:hypothetical protein